MTTKIAKHLHQRLAELNMRPSDLAKAIGVPRATVGQWVNGEVNPRWENLQKISTALDVDFFWLIVGKDSNLPDKLTKISKPDVSKRIRERKLELHLTVKDLEAMTMSSNSTVNQWLRGDTYPSLEKVELLATTLICSKEWLLFGVGERPMIPEEILKIEAFPDLPDLPERIKHRLNFLGLKPIDISKNLGVGKGSVSQWMHGVTKPSGRYIPNLATFLKADVQWLLSGKMSPNNLLLQNKTIDTSMSDSGDHLLPFLEHSELASNNDSFIPSRYLTFSSCALDRAGVNAENAFCVKINIPSMYPLFPDGTTIGVNRAIKKIKDGKVYAFKHYDLFRVAALYNQPNGSIRVKNINESEYPEEILRQDEIENIDIIGHVFWYSVILSFD